MFAAALVTVIQNQRQHKCPSSDERINKLWCPHSDKLLGIQMEQTIALRFTKMFHYAERRKPILEGHRLPDFRSMTLSKTHHCRIGEQIRFYQGVGVGRCACKGAAPRSVVGVKGEYPILIVVVAMSSYTCDKPRRTVLKRKQKCSSCRVVIEKTQMADFAVRASLCIFSIHTSWRTLKTSYTQCQIET